MVYNHRFFLDYNNLLILILLGAIRFRPDGVQSLDSSWSTIIYLFNHCWVQLDFDLMVYNHRFSFSYPILQLPSLPAPFPSLPFQVSSPTAPLQLLTFQLLYRPGTSQLPSHPVTLLSSSRPSNSSTVQLTTPGFFSPPLQLSSFLTQIPSTSYQLPSSSLPTPLHLPYPLTPFLIRIPIAPLPSLTARVPPSTASLPLSSSSISSPYSPTLLKSALL